MLFVALNRPEICLAIEVDQGNPYAASFVVVNECSACLVTAFSLRPGLVKWSSKYAAIFHFLWPWPGFIQPK
jgi:hypothetical protein